jgi:hypothetical protein
MSMPPPAGFLVNDPEHVPFGAPWLRGITPLRVLAVAGVCWFYALGPSATVIARDGFGEGFNRILFWSLFFFVCSLPTLFVVVKADVWSAAWPARARLAAFAMAVVCGSMLFGLAGLLWRTQLGGMSFADPQSYLFLRGDIVRSLLVGGLLAAVLHIAGRERQLLRELHGVRLTHVELDKQVAEARLQLLQAQIEPHFLFNSLASVKLLYEKEPDRGRALLRNLADYLRMAIPHARRREATLGEEAALARSFLSIFEVRMGERLRVRIDIPPEVEDALIPPLMVGTLVENAIKHGIAPRASGGCVSLTARRIGAQLEIRVIDDGVGFRAQSGSGVGLANVRSRLLSLHGEAGVLELARNADSGVTVTMRVPFRVEAAVA